MRYQAAGHPVAARTMAKATGGRQVSTWSTGCEPRCRKSSIKEARTRHARPLIYGEARDPRPMVQFPARNAWPRHRTDKDMLPMKGFVLTTQKRESAGRNLDYVAPAGGKQRQQHRSASGQLALTDSAAAAAFTSDACANALGGTVAALGRTDLRQALLVADDSLVDAKARHGGTSISSRSRPTPATGRSAVIVMDALDKDDRISQFPRQCPGTA